VSGWAGVQSSIIAWRTTPPPLPILYTRQWLRHDAAHSEIMLAVEKLNTAARKVRFLGDAKSSLGDAKSSLGDAKSSLGDAKSSLGDAMSSLGDAKSSLGDA
jgi:hypothetical protein